jgi:hypothetical protein
LSYFWLFKFSVRQHCPKLLSLCFISLERLMAISFLCVHFQCSWTYFPSWWTTVGFMAHLFNFCFLIWNLLRIEEEVLGTLVQIFRIISEVENVSVMDLTTKKKKNYNKGPVASLKTFKHHVNLLYQKRLILYLCGNGMVVKVFGFSSCLLEYFLTIQHALHTQYKNY